MGLASGIHRLASDVDAPAALPVSPQGFSQEQLQTLLNAASAVLGQFATASRWTTKSVPAQPNQAALVSSADPRRIGLAIQLPASLSAWIGPSMQVGPGGTGTVPGYLLPVGGGWVFGPENRLDVYLVHNALGQQDIRVMEFFG